MIRKVTLDIWKANTERDAILQAIVDPAWVFVIFYLEFRLA